MIVEAQARLEQLKQEFAAGERQLAELRQEEAGLRETLLRISGAIQVLHELVEDPAARQDAGPATGTVPAQADGSTAEPGTVLTVA